MEVDLEHNAGNDDKTVVAARDYQVSSSLSIKGALKTFKGCVRQLRISICKSPPLTQNELLRKALVENSIVFLGTGAGKTYIATMLIKELGAPLR